MSFVPVSRKVLHQESADSNYLLQVTCVTLGVVLNLMPPNILLQNTECNELAAAPSEVSLKVALCVLRQNGGWRQNIT